jgi:Ca-activated chloride channel family protein
MKPGAAEIRYMSGQGAKVLAQRALAIVPATIRISAPTAATVGSAVSIEWSGPNNPGDYLTIVPKTSKAGTSVRRLPTTRSSPARLDVPQEAGPCEIRYMSGQGNLVLARADIEVK